jgi:hypothetical protein
MSFGTSLVGRPQFPSNTHTILPSLLVFFCCYVYFFSPFLPSWSEDTSTTITPFSLVITYIIIVTCDSKHIQKSLKRNTLLLYLSIYTHLFLSLSLTHTPFTSLTPLFKSPFFYSFFSPSSHFPTQTLLSFSSLLFYPFSPFNFPYSFILPSKP